jgi:hypothetical protein
VAMNPLQKLMSWWRGPTDGDTLASEAEARRLQADRQTIKHSQAGVGKGAGGSLVGAPTPDVLDPGSEHSTRSR